MSAPRIGSSAPASTLTTARLTTPLPSRFGAGRNGRACGAFGLTGLSDKSRMDRRLGEGFVSRSRICIAKRVASHAFRHTCASILTAFTLATYVHLLDGDLEEPLAIL